MKNLWISCSIVTLFFTGCSTEVPKPKNKKEVIEKTKISFDKYSKKTIATSPPIINKAKGLNIWSTTQYLQYMNKNNSSFYGIIFSDIHGGEKWVHYSHAYDLDGTELKVKNINSDVHCSHNSCTFYETVIIELPNKKYLESHLKNGFEIKINGRYYNIIKFDNFYIEGFLKALEINKQID